MNLNRRLAPTIALTAASLLGGSLLAASPAHAARVDDCRQLLVVAEWNYNMYEWSSTFYGPKSPEAKGYLKRNRDAKAYVYRPTKGKSKVLGSMVSDFVNRVFDGSAKPLLVHLVENEHLSQEELEEIARLMKEKQS